ncbi:MAG: secretin N-terminal domain-containing protein [Kiritimatiellia bacterium]
MKHLLLLLSLLPVLIQAQDPAPLQPDSDSTFLKAVGNGVDNQQTIRPQYRGASLEILLQEIGDRTGKVILRDPAVPEVTINLVSKNPMSVNEFLKAAESLLAMNNIALVPFREDFIKVVPLAGVERAGAPLQLDPAELQGDESQVISQIIALKHLDYTEVQNLITERLSPNAKVQIMERNNSMLITDTRGNIGRIQKILGVLDRPAEVREAVKIYQLSNAAAADVKARLESLIEESQAQQASRNAGGTSRFTPVTPNGVIRPGGNSPVTPNAVVSGSQDAGPSPGLIQGKVQIVADERTNVLMIISRPENDAFFEEMIAALDKKVDPEVVVRIYNLQFADAEEVSETLNELIGAASENREGPGVNNENQGNVSGQSVREFIRQQPANNQTPSSSEGTQNISQLAENTRILADIRSNSLILMGRSKDLTVLEDVIRQLDIMLAQVAVRAVIMEVILSDNISYGVDWLQRSLTVNNVQNVNGVPVREPVFSFAGGQRLETSNDFPELSEIGRDITLNSGGLTYFSTFYDFNLDVILRLAQGSSDAKVIATPIIITTDNTEGSIRVG